MKIPRLSLGKELQELRKFESLKQDYVISPEDYAARIAELREAAGEAGRDPGEIELTVWPASFDFTRGFDLDFVRSYVETGVDRLMLSAQESGGTTIEDARQLIRNYSDQILSKL